MCIFIFISSSLSELFGIEQIQYACTDCERFGMKMVDYTEQYI